MSENKLNVVVPKDYSGAPIEVVLREGKAPVALDLQYQLPLVLKERLTALCVGSKNEWGLSIKSGQI